MRRGFLRHVRVDPRKPVLDVREIRATLIVEVMDHLSDTQRQFTLLARFALREHLAHALDQFLV